MTCIGMTTRHKHSKAILCQAVETDADLLVCRAKAARKAREAGQSEKRRKMREDLEKREGAYQTARNDEQRARNKLKVSKATTLICTCRGL